MIVIWHWLVHVTGCDYGLPYGHFAWYNLYSGFAASYPYVVIPGAALFWYHHSCHDRRWCLRWAKHPDATGMFKYCRHHHPDLAGQKLTREFRHRLHHEAKARAAR
jgi:hypothetical protein